VKPRPRGQAGFTLLEVLAALAIVAFGLAALWKGLGQGIAVTQSLPDRVMARWVAQNRLVLRQARGDWPDTRTHDGKTEMGGRTWYWEEQVTSTDSERLRRVTVTVGIEEEDPNLVSLEGYVYRGRGPAGEERP